MIASPLKEFLRKRDSILAVFGNKMPEEIFMPKTGQVRVTWRMLLVEGFAICAHLSQNAKTT